jgi:predicted AAA+ superfamily ATPase
MTRANRSFSLRRFVSRLDRVLTLAESLLLELTGSSEGDQLFERFHAFSWDAGRGPGRLVPIQRPDRFHLHDLIGVERPLARLVQNTEQFVRRLPANHVLLFGERGTGKSSAVKGLLERFATRGLRLVEVQKRELAQLPRILQAIEQLGGASYRFLIYCDDLSFGQGEAGYRELKAALEGSLHAPPENVLIVATSNRRHLLPESMADNRRASLDGHGDLHLGEALEEKLALSDRFGLVLGFYSFDQDTYLEIVAHYIAREKLSVTLDEVRADALRWALNRDSRSGRTARQFVNDLSGRLALEREQ